MSLAVVEDVSLEQVYLEQGGAEIGEQAILPIQERFRASLPYLANLGLTSIPFLIINIALITWLCIRIK